MLNRSWLELSEFLQVKIRFCCRKCVVLVVVVDVVLAFPSNSATLRTDMKSWIITVSALWVSTKNLKLTFLVYLAACFEADLWQKHSQC